MKLRTNERIIIIVFVALSVVSLAVGFVYYFKWYQDKYETRKIEIAAEKTQKEAQEKAKKEAEKKAKEEEKKRKRLARIEEAKGQVIPAYTQFLSERQYSAEYSTENDRYFIYDLNSDGVPELFITKAEAGSETFKEYSLYCYGLKSKEVEEITVPDEYVVSFFTAKKGIFSVSRADDGTIIYNQYKLSGGELKKTEAGKYQYYHAGQKCYVDGNETDPIEYATLEEDFHQDFIKAHIEIQEYTLSDTTPLDAFMPEGNINESVTIIAQNAINNKYNGKLLFQPVEVTDMGDYYQVTGELWQSVYVAAKDVKDINTGDDVDINGSFYTVTEVNGDGVINFSEDNLCLKKNFKGNEKYAFYGSVPSKYYEAFKMDTGRPLHDEIITNITLNFDKKAFVIMMNDESIEEDARILSTAEELFETDAYGNLVNKGSYGYIRLENGMIYSYLELP